MPLKAQLTREGSAYDAACNIFQIARYCGDFSSQFLNQIDTGGLLLDEDIDERNGKMLPGLVHPFLPALVNYKSRWPILIAVPNVLTQLKDNFIFDVIESDLEEAIQAITEMISFIEQLASVNGAVISKTSLSDGSGRMKAIIIRDSKLLEKAKLAFIKFRGVFPGGF